MGMKRTSDSLMEAPIATVLCCSCGTPMVPNQTMRCAQCLKTEISITDGISRQVVLPHCRNCGRYNKPPWGHCEPESRELLGMCLKRIKGIGRDVRLVDASFIWTEEHSKRIKVKISVQKEVAANSVLQQTMVVEFQICNEQCLDCQKSFTPHTWQAVVQVRHKVSHRRTLCYLEQLILKHDAHEKVISLKETREGLDFHFGQRSHAQRFADFVQSFLPTKIKNSKHLVSHDANSNTYAYKYSIQIDLCTVCMDDLVYVPRGHSQLLNAASPAMLCHKVSTAVHLLDPLTKRGCDLPAYEFWKKPLEAVAERSQMTEFIVLNVEPVDAPEAGSRAKHHLAGREKMQLADIEVARACDLGVNDDRLIVRSHLGRILRPGNRVLGYDMRYLNVSGLNDESVEGLKTDAILVRKVYQRKKHRAWDVKRLERNNEDGVEAVNDDADMEAMRQDLEEEPEMRRHVNMYRQPDKKQAEAAAVAPPVAAAEAAATAKEEAEEEGDDEDEDAPEVPLAELLEGLELNDEGSSA
mmetsp:Transcript_57640/g.100875  ORF Transcript_57640/g.100875 Transcript_57640/m.100875 type:complete len:525 (+) Transcript_57640:78-1652(+)